MLDDTTYVRLCARQLWEEAGTLLPATLVALVVAAPWLAAVALALESLAPMLLALTAAPAWAGLVGVATAVTIGESASPLTVLWAARRYFTRAAAIGAATSGFSWSFEMALRIAGESSVAALPLIAISGAAMLLLLIIDVYAFPLLTLYDLPLRSTIRNALGLAAASPSAAIGLLAAGMLALFLLNWFGPGTLLATLPVLAVLMVNGARLQVQRLQS